MFGYTRLMVAAFGLGAGWSALDRAIPYSRKRIQAGGPLSEKQGYTHKLIVPHAIALEAARAAIEETAERIDAGEGELQIEGAVAKYLATEAGDAAADAAIQAHGGYGYTHDYMVEKIKRDVRITRIYEGTSEIMEITIARGRWQEHLKSGGSYYHDGRGSSSRCTPRTRRSAPTSPRSPTTRSPNCSSVPRGEADPQSAHPDAPRRADRSLRGRGSARAPRAPVRRQAAAEGLQSARAGAVAAASRVNARNVAMTVATESIRWVGGADGGVVGDLEQRLGLAAIYRAQGGLLADLQPSSTPCTGACARDDRTRPRR